MLERRPLARVYAAQVKNRFGRLNVDLQLLACLDALISERSVTRAAERLEMSQPGMSNALARLRRVTNDQILVRTARGMVPTARAREMAESVQTAMHALEDVLGDRGPFDPSTARGVITVATTDFPSILIFPLVMERLRALAPGVTVEMRLPDPLHVTQWLTEGECDLVIGYLPEPSSGLRFVDLFEEKLACIASSDQKFSAPLELNDFLRVRHVVHGSPFAQLSTVETMLESEFARQGARRRVGVRVSSVMQSPYMVVQTDLLAVLPAALARHFAKILPVQLVPTSFELPRIKLSMAWHERSHRLGMHMWIRELIRDVVAREFDAASR